MNDSTLTRDIPWGVLPMPKFGQGWPFSLTQSQNKTGLETSVRAANQKRMSVFEIGGHSSMDADIG
jgi:hypothetical protein